MDFFHSLLKTTQGQSVARTAMNQSFRGMTLPGKILDIGGARNPDYFSYLNLQEGSMIDVTDGSLSQIDFEKDTLPYADETYDSVVLCNVLEHIFNHSHLLAEASRVMKKEGTFLGFVPFLIQYHADPHDYFRYTHEALQKLLEKAGFTGIKVTPVGKGPSLVLCSALIQGIPRFLRPLWFIPCYLFDTLFSFFKKDATRRFPLGYTFTATK